MKNHRTLSLFAATVFVATLQIRTAHAQTLVNQHAYLKASNTRSGDGFGWSVAISGDTAVVGAVDLYGGTNSSGAAYVFIRSGDTWRQQAYLKASNPDAEDLFGYSVAISGDTIVVGAWGEDGAATGVNGNQGSDALQDSGAAYVFVREGTNWTQQAYLKASNTGPSEFTPAHFYGDGFGWSVGISGETIVVGAPYEDSAATTVNGSQNNNNAPDSGAAYVFVRNGATWSQQAYLKASNASREQFFGTSVAASGDDVVVGGPGDAAYVFVRNETTWIEQGLIPLVGSGPLAVSGDTLVVGKEVFVRGGSIWTHQATLAIPTNFFISGVGISGDTVVVSDPYEASNATGVDGNPDDTSAPVSGAAYLFIRDGTTWSNKAYVKASNAQTYDYFGVSAAVSGTTVILGAFQESSNATGVDGDQSDNSAPGSGAAYVFNVTPLPLLNIQRLANNVVLIWTNAAFGLQSAPAITGTFTNVPGATSPHTNSISGGRQFFRLIAN